MENNSNEEQGKTQLREEDFDVREGAQQTGQLESLKQNAEENRAPKDPNMPDPSVVEVNNGENVTDQGNADNLKVRGSGYTYDEEVRPTDESAPLDEGEGQIVPLPDLGKPNRP